jgi:hypothetical protein
MGAVEPAKQRMGRHLREAIEHLRSDLDRVEFWADALDGLAQPVPDYDQRDCGLSRFNLGSDQRPCQTDRQDSHRDDRYGLTGEAGDGPSGRGSGP